MTKALASARRCLQPRRQLVVGNGGVRGQLELLEQLGQPRPASAAARARSSAAAMSRISRGVRLHRNEALPDERLMRSRTRCGVADHVEAEDARVAAVGQEERGQDREQRGLAGAVRPQHPEDRAARDDERHAPESGLQPPSRPSRAKRLC